MPPRGVTRTLSSTSTQVSMRDEGAETWDDPAAWGLASRLDESAQVDGFELLTAPRALWLDRAHNPQWLSWQRSGVEGGTDLQCQRRNGIGDCTWWLWQP
jgi:hypothetical protein